MALVPFPAGDAHDPPRAIPVPADPDGPPAPPQGGAPDEFQEEEPLEGGMTFLEHLDELRKRLTRAVVGLLVGIMVAFAFIERVFDYVMRPLKDVIPGGRLVFTEPTEAFFLYIKVAAIVGLMISSPYLMWQVWQFVVPGLYAKEKRLAIPFVIGTSSLFVAGAAFAHFVVFPIAWAFFAGFSTDYMEFLPRIAPVFSLYAKMLLAFGIAFQMPMIILVLAKLGVVTSGFLIRKFKYATLLIFILAALLTPPDPVSQTLMAAPMILLYFVSIGVAWMVGPKDGPEPTP
jgi:sec-independent protein translocase protein TatC